MAYHPPPKKKIYNKTKQNKPNQNASREYLGKGTV